MSEQAGVDEEKLEAYPGWFPKRVTRFATRAGQGEIMTADELDQIMADLEDELVDYAIPVWMIPAWVRGTFQSLDELAAMEASIRICEVLLSRKDLALVWVQGHYDRPAPDGWRTLSWAAPSGVTHDMLEGPEDMLTPDPYIAIDRLW